MRHPRLFISRAATSLAVLFLAAVIWAVPQNEASAATSGHTLLANNQVQFWVNDAPWADVHYQLNGGAQQNVRMTPSGRNHALVVSNVPNGTVVRYFYTIGVDAGGATDTAWVQFTRGTTPTPTPTPGGPVCFFENTNYGGASFCNGAGNFGVPAGWNDRASSVRVQSGYRAILYRDSNFTGTTLTLTADEPNLVNRAFNDAMTSFRISLVTGPTPTPTPTPTPVGGWTIIWEDQFNGSGQPDASNWNYHVGNGFNPGLADFQGWGNGEWEWYRPSNAFQQGGNLVIRADYNTAPTVINGRNWHQFSSRLTTKGKRSWQYGRIEARIAMPNAIATWPAFWMMGTACDDTVTTTYSPAANHFDTMASNWASCGEVDIMEHRNTETITFQNLFWDTRTGLFPWGNGLNAEQPHQQNVGNVAQFHLYTLEWEANQIRWYVDRETNPNPVHTVNTSAANMEEFRKPFHIIMNLAISGQFTGFAQPNQADFPLFMYVDYVRVWRRN
jgi:beta-glucanase (GH16 family)